MYNSVFKATKIKSFNKNIFGFDIETYSKKNKFYCASIYHPDPKLCQYFDDKRELIEHFKLKRYKDSFITATNLAFDFMGTFHKQPEELEFNMLWRGSSMLFAKTFSKDKKFMRKKVNNAIPVTFIDTMNYANLSVEKLGKIIGYNKLGKPSFLGRIPNNQEEIDELKFYNMQDSKISCEGLRFLFDSFSKIGATPKTTIASTSMSLYKNKYLGDKEYYRHPVDVLDKIFKGYYGGRTEVFSRGKIKNYNYYDVNSLYPFVMSKFEYPNPNTMRHTGQNTVKYINNFEGMSLVKININSLPDNHQPLLPLHFDNKLLFPMGTFISWQTHTELRKAQLLGYNILKVYDTIYYKETCSPFIDFVNDMYEIRNELKLKKDPMEYVVKILMNSLYGKFGQKFRDKDNWIPIPDYDELMKLKEFQPFGDYIRVKKAFTPPTSFCVPIWASYVTSYARQHLYDLISLSNPVYVDTDSIITKKYFEDSKKLGKLKLEYKVHDGLIVKPKMYAIKGERYQLAKLKGLGKKINFHEFTQLLQNPKIAYNKFTKFKEAMRRGLDVNEILEVFKEFSLEDTKRDWYGQTFNIDELQPSKPIVLTVNDNMNFIQSKPEKFINPRIVI